MLPEGNFQLLSTLAHHMLRPIVPVAVLPDQLHVLYELLGTGVEVVKESLPYGAEVHRLADDVEVVKYVELYGVDWLDEVEGAFLLGATCYDFEGDLVPCLHLHAFYLLLGDAVWIRGQFFELRDGFEQF